MKQKIKRRHVAVEHRVPALGRIHTDQGHPAANGRQRRAGLLQIGPRHKSPRPGLDLEVWLVWSLAN